MDSEHVKQLSFAGEIARFRSVKEVDAAIKDLLEFNYFSIAENACGPYNVVLDIAEKRLVFNITPTASKKIKSSRVQIPLSSFRSIIKDYFIILESHQDALNQGLIEKVEAIDMGRRGMHNEGAEILLGLLENKINLDFETARRFFTIITALHLT